MYKKSGFDFGSFTITKREILASISIILIMLIIGNAISNLIVESQIAQNEVYNKAVKIDDTELFQYGMDTNIGNAFVYGELKAVDTVTFSEIDGEYMYIKKQKELYERHEKWVEEKDSDGNVHKELKVWYEWETQNTESLHCKDLEFCGIAFPYNKIDIPGSAYIKTISSGKEWSWKSSEYVKVRYVYYGTKAEFKGTIYTSLKNGTISDKTSFYENKTINETVERLQTGGAEIVFWLFWFVLIAVCVYGFFYLDNKWLEG